MNTIVAICGPSGAGKTALLEGLAEWMKRREVGFHHIPSHTTRPPRLEEGHNGTYRFLSKDVFLDEFSSGGFAECDFFKGYDYGTLKSSLDESDIGSKAITIRGLEQLLDVVPRRRVLAVRIVLDRHKLVQRLRERNESEKFITDRLAGVPESGDEWGCEFTRRWDLSIHNHTGMLEAYVAGLGEIVIGHDSWLNGRGKVC